MATDQRARKVVRANPVRTFPIRTAGVAVVVVAQAVRGPFLHFHPDRVGVQEMVARVSRRRSRGLQSHTAAAVVAELATTRTPMRTLRRVRRTHRLPEQVAQVAVVREASARIRRRREQRIPAVVVAAVVMHTVLVIRMLQVEAVARASSSFATSFPPPRFLTLTLLRTTGHRQATISPRAQP